MGLYSHPTWQVIVGGRQQAQTTVLFAECAAHTVLVKLHDMTKHQATLVYTFNAVRHRPGVTENGVR